MFTRIRLLVLGILILTFGIVLLAVDLRAQRNYATEHMNALLDLDRRLYVLEIKVEAWRQDTAPVTNASVKN